MNRLPRRILLLLLPLALLFSTGTAALTAGSAYPALQSPEGGTEPLLAKTRAYTVPFPDVSPEQWYYPYVIASYEYGLIGGRENGFAPESEITVAELLTLSARLHAAYAGEEIPPLAQGDVWYAPYVLYLYDKDLLDLTLPSLDVPATRAQLAGIFSLSLPAECFDNLNGTLVTDAYASGAYISDVGEYTPYQPQILWLYRQGLLSGMDDSGSYWPDRTTTRAETAALITRMVDPSLRIALSWAVTPNHSAAGKTLASLIQAPSGKLSDAPSLDDDAAIDALIRKMLAADEYFLSLDYGRAITRSYASTIANVFTNCVKSYCEQMYNSVLCQSYSNGSVLLTFSATSCSDSLLAQYRTETMERAIQVHDMLWDTGQLTDGMSQYEIAQVYYSWLCDNCEYDYPGADDDASISHIAYGALINKLAVCDGYTGAYNLFLKLDGIDCYALANDTHIWTVATLDGQEYHIDVTWGDQTGQVDMSYFAMSEAESFSAHPW